MSPSLLSLSFLFSLLLSCSSSFSFVTSSSLFSSSSSSPRAIPRSSAPLFTAPAVFNNEFTSVSLQSYFDDGQWVVLLFYPFDFTFVCPTEIIAFSEQATEFSSINTKLLAISTDSHHTHLAWSRTKQEDGGLGEVAIPLVADISKTISHNYGVLVEDETDPMFGAALRGLFIIDPKGKIRSMQINDDQVGRNPEEVKRTVMGFQYAEAHQGEVCPSKWSPGSRTIHANPQGIRDYFMNEKKSEL